MKMKRQRKGARGEERKEVLTGDLKMRAEQRSPEEYKSQLGYPNTSKTILHISANTFWAGGPGQRRHSHTCTHTRMHTCTLAPSPFGFLFFFLLLLVLFLHLP